LFATTMKSCATSFRSRNLEFYENAKSSGPLERQIVHVVIADPQAIDRVPRRVVLLHEIVFDAFCLSRAEDRGKIERTLADGFECFGRNMLVVLHRQTFFFIF